MESSGSAGKVGMSPHSNLQQCSVCLEPVGLDAQERSIAKLKCGHLFHLDCIGSSHNSKGIMQCPNCRDIEDGNWYYAVGNTDPEDIAFGDTFHEEDFMVDMNPYIEIYESHQHFNPLSWHPYDASYPQTSIPVGELEIAAGDYPGTLVAFVCEDALSACPFLPVNESRSSRHPTGYDSTLGYDSIFGAPQHRRSDSLDSSARHPTGYDSMVGAFRHMQSDSLGGEVARHEISRYMQIESLGAEAARHLHSIPLDDAGSRRVISHRERPVPYRVPSDLGVTQRHIDVGVASPSTVWTEPNPRGHVQRGMGPLPSSGSILGGLDASSRWRYRRISGAGSIGQMNESRGQFRLGLTPPSGGQDTGIASVPGTNWQGDQGIPWRRNGYSDCPWVALEPESWRRNSPASSSTNISSFHGANGLRNGTLRTASGFPAYPSNYQHDGSRVVGSMIPQSTRRPR